MKKLLYVAILAVALVLASCGNGVDKLPKDLRAVIESADKEARDVYDESEDYIYKGVKVENHNIIFTFQVSEDERDGKTLKRMLKKSGYSKEAFANRLLKEIKLDAFEDSDENIFALLRDNKYNLIIRFYGKDEEDKVESKISYRDIPDEEDDDEWY